MKALVPSGGRGTRLRPITHTSAKQLIPVANKPMLYYVLEDIAAAGITDVGIVVGDTADEIIESVDEGERWGARVTYIRQDAPSGLAHTLLIARDFLGDEPFVMYLGDNILRDGIVDFVRAFERDTPAAQILVVPVADPRRYGNVEMNGDVVTRLVEKPKQPRSDLALAGVYLFDARVHDAVRAIAPSARGELEITDAIQWLLDRGEPVRAVRAEGWWKDTGRVEDLLEANRLVLAGGAGSRGDAIIENSTISDPVAIAAGARIVNSEIGPNVSIGPSCEIRDSKIDDSIILEGCTVTGARLTGSLLGRGVVVEPTIGAHRLVVGDHGQVWFG